MSDSQTWLVNANIFASERYYKQYSVAVTFTSKPVSVYWPSLAVALFCYFY